MKTVAPSASADEAITRFRARLIRRRDEASLSRRELAKECGLDISTVTRLELGERVPSFALSVALADALGVAVKDLYDDRIDDADLAALARVNAAHAEQERGRAQRRSGAEMWPMKTTLKLGTGQRCLYPFEPCTCRIWVARGRSDSPPVDVPERMDA